MFTSDEDPLNHMDQEEIELMKSIGMQTPHLNKPDFDFIMQLKHFRLLLVIMDKFHDNTLTDEQHARIVQNWIHLNKPSRAFKDATTTGKCPKFNPDDYCVHQFRNLFLDSMIKNDNQTIYFSKVRAGRPGLLMPAALLQKRLGILQAEVKTFRKVMMDRKSAGRRRQQWDLVNTAFNVMMKGETESSLLNVSKSVSTGVLASKHINRQAFRAHKLRKMDEKRYGMYLQSLEKLNSQYITSEWAENLDQVTAKRWTNYKITRSNLKYATK